MEKVYRAYIPREGVKWFNIFVGKNPEIDLWLMSRHDDQRDSVILEHENQTIGESISQYRYYSEFKAKNSDFIESHLNEFQRHNIKLEVMIDNLKKYMSRRRPSGTIKRSLNAAIPTKSIVGKYVGFNDVISCFSLKKYF